MKKQVKSFIMGVIVTTLLMNTALGDAVKKNIEVVYNSVNLTINGKKVEADNILYNGTTYVPLRKVAEMLEKEVGWDAKTSTASINDIGYVEETIKEEIGKKPNYEIGKGLADIAETGKTIIVKVPAMPELGFKWPYMLKIPTNTYKKENADATKRYLMFEMANTILEKPEEMEITVKERLESLSPSTIWLAEKTWSPVMMPLIPRSHAGYWADKNYNDRNSVFEHQLDRDTVMLKKLKGDGYIGPQIIDSYYEYGYNIDDFLDYDKQILAMIDHAIEYLNEYGHKVENKILIGGDSASGHFSNRFSTLYPEKVKISTGGMVISGVMAPIPEHKGEKLVYPIGTYDYKEITGKKFDLKEYNKVARLLYFGKEDPHEALMPTDVYGNVERDIMIKLFGAHLDNPLQRIRNVNKFYIESGGKTIIAYMDKTGHSISNEMYDYLLQFYKENIRSEVPVYNMPKNKKGLEVEIYK